MPPNPNKELTDSLIDACAAYVEDKDCSYLAKEGLIVNYMSITGRKSDFMWHKHTINETLRIIRAVRLSPKLAKELKESHLLTAFQEASRVYEFGVKTRHATAEGIFNYSEHSEMSIGDEAMSLLVETLQMQGMTALKMNPVVTLFNVIQEKLKLGIGAKDARDLMFKHFEGAGYVIKTGPHRPLIDNKKQPAIMMKGTKPAEVVGIRTEEATKIIAKIYGELV